MAVHYGLVIPHGYIDLTAPSHYLNQCCFSLVRLCGIHLRAISQGVPKLLFFVIFLIMIHLTLLPHLPGCNELTQLLPVLYCVDCQLGTWSRHQMENFSALLAICAGNSPVNSLHKGQWRGALMFSLICTWMNGWVNSGDLRCHRSHYDVTVMMCSLLLVMPVLEYM